MKKAFQAQISWWITTIGAFVVAISFLLGLSFRVEALERDSVTFNSFIRLYNEQQKDQTTNLVEMKTSLNLITGYFKLTPKEAR